MQAHLPLKSQQIQRNDVPDKEAWAQKQRISPGRAVRGKLVNMVLYCTHDMFSFSFGVSNKNWHYMFYTLLKILSLTLYKNKVTQNKIKATSHKNLQLHKKENISQILVHHYMDEELTIYTILV